MSFAEKTSFNANSRESNADSRECSFSLSVDLRLPALASTTDRPGICVNLPSK